MRKFFMCAAAALMMQLPALAQGIEVVSDEQLSLPGGEAVYAPVISPAGDFVLVTSSAMSGLLKYDLATGALSTVTTDSGAGFNPKISADGSLIVYRESTIKNKLRYNTVKAVEVASGKTKTIVKESRGVTAFAANQGTAVAINSDKVVTKKITGKKVATPAIASISDGNLMLTTGGETVKLNPKGDSRYLWVSVSPDGTRVLFTVPESGMVAYTCDLDGGNLSRIGRMSAPVWMGNDWVVGMVDHDNGEVVTESYIVAATATGEAYTRLTGSETIAMYPSATLDATKIVYNTADGTIHLMNITTK